MSSIIKVDQIQLADGSTPTASDLGITGTGKVLQVVSTVKTDTQSGTYAGATPIEVSGLTATITPSSTSSKILVTVSLAVGTSSSNHIGCRLYRDTTGIALGDSASNRPRMSFTGTMEITSTGWMMQQPAFTFLDTPNTTSSTTYSVRVGGNGSATIYINRSYRDNNNANEDCRYVSTITVMEIAG